MRSARPGSLETVYSSSFEPRAAWRTVMPLPVHLEPEAKAFAETTANPPYLFDLGPEKGRKTVDEVQSGPIDKPEVDAREAAVPAGKLVSAWLAVAEFP